MKSVLDEKLVKDKILDYEWYIKQLTLLLKKSYGVNENIKLGVDVDKIFNDVILEFFNLIGYYDEESQKWVLNIKEIDRLDSENKTSDILDKMATIFGVSRTYHFPKNYILKEGEDVVLNNRELFCLIYTQIIRNNFDGSTKQLYELFNKLYELTNIENEKGERYPFNLQYDTITSVSYPYAYITLNAKQVIDEETGEVKEQYKNLAELVFQNVLLIKSMGIKYNVDIINWELLGIYDNINGVIEDRNLWDKGVFGA